jgi:ParB/RepB/Spo0J family partition protein
MSTTTTPAVRPDVVPISAIERSPTNPREFFDTEKEKQLAATLQPPPIGVGFLQKLLVRPWPGREGVFELVDGERRWRAAKSIGLTEVPVTVRDLTDAEVVAIQLVAGDTGEPLAPLEEAKGFKCALELKDANGQACYTLRSLAEKLGCSKTHIEQRTDLLRLPTTVREWVASGSLAPRTANLLARIPDPEARDRAIQDIVFPKLREDPLPFKEAEAVIHERYMVSLRNAPFEQGDATLDGPEGTPLACAACPLKTGNNPEKFGDVKDKNTCTNPACYRKKCNLGWERTAAKAKAAGQRVLTDEETDGVFEKNSPTVQIAFSSPYVDVDSKPSYRHVPNEVEDKNLPTWRELINTAAEKKGIKVPIVLARDRTGKQWQLVQLALCVEAARAIGEDMFKKTPVNESLSAKDRFDRDSVRTAVRQTDNFAEKKKAEADAAKLRMAECLVGLDALYTRLSSQDTFKNGMWGLLLHTALHHAGNDGQALITKWLKLKTDGGDFGHADAIEAWFKKALPPATSVYKDDRRAAHALVPLLLIAQSLRWNGLKCEGFISLAEGHSIDVKALQKEAAAQFAEKEKPAKGAKKKPAATSAPTSPDPVTTDKKTLAEWVKAHAKGMPIAEIARSYKVSEADVSGALGLTKPAAAAAPAQAPLGVAAAAIGLSEGKYVAVKTLLVLGKAHAAIADQLKITVGQVDSVARREVVAAKVGAKKSEAGKAAKKPSAPAKKTPGKAGKKGAK